MNKNTITMYKPFKIAQDFTVQYFGICIPKNAIYGRLTKISTFLLMISVNSVPICTIVLYQYTY